MPRDQHGGHTRAETTRRSDTADTPAARSRADTLPDQDGDEITDDLDDCPALAEDGNHYDQHDGCPDGWSAFAQDTWVHPFRATFQIGARDSSLGAALEIRGNLRLYAVELSVQSTAFGMGFGGALAPFEIGSWTNSPNTTGVTFEPVMGFSFYPFHERTVSSFELGLRIHLHVEGAFMVGIDVRWTVNFGLLDHGMGYLALGEIGAGVLR
ncbi:MAG: hypothetical protein U0353_07745 [Sandaracinus sp.]